MATASLRADRALTSTGRTAGTGRRPSAFAASVGLGAMLLIAMVGLAAAESTTQAVSALAMGAAFQTIAGCGLMVARAVSGHPVGRMLTASGLLLLMSTTAELYARHGRLAPGAPLPGSRGIGVLSTIAFGLTVLTFLYALALFPSGRAASRRARRVLDVTGILYVATGLGSMLAPGPVEGLLTGEALAQNPLALDGTSTVAQAASAVNGGLMALLALIAASSLLVRYRRSTGDERLQLKCVLLGAALALIAIPLDPVAGADGVLFLIGLLALPVAMGIAMVKFRLYSVDRIINRALLYAAISALAAVTYVLVVSAMDAVTRNRLPVGLSALTAGVMALLLVPAYLHLQRVINRVTFGIGEDPRTVLRRLGRLLETSSEDGALLPEVAASLAQALRVPFVAIDTWGHQAYRREAEVGQPDAQTFSLPLRHNGSMIGRLVLGTRDASRRLRSDTHEALSDLMPQIAAAVATVQLGDELRASRDRLITARHEERRRIEHDLHDGLGPTLASIGLQADLARSLLPDADDEPQRLLRSLKQLSVRGVREVRRIVHGLTPLAVEELGLVDALIDEARALTTGPHGVVVRILVPDPLPALPAATQVGAYRIACEAMTNAARHSAGTRIDTTLTVSRDHLQIDVRDDGIGLGEAVHLGVGLVSMRERATLLGGHCSIERRCDAGGTAVHARLPLAPR